jgi:hypothetical protein
MEEIRTVLVGTGLGTIILGVAGWLIRELVKYLLSSDLEVYKERLRSETEKELIEHGTVFGGLYRKRAEVVSELYEKLSDAISASNHFLNPFGFSGGPPKEELGDEALL